nr:IS630 family transposase [Planococcus lenghuensis]
MEQRLAEIHRLLKTETNVRHYQRIHVIHLHLQGYRNGEIAKIEKLTEKTVGTYIKKYRTLGVDGLKMGHSPGAPPRLTPEQEEQVYEVVLNRTPSEVGLKTTMNWTGPLVREWIRREFDVRYTNRDVLSLLQRLGFSHTRPTYTLAKADPVKQGVFRTGFQDVKKLASGEIDTILFQDESTIRDYMAIGYTWFLKGKQRKIPTTGQHQSVKLLGVLDYETGAVFCLQDQLFNGETFLCFLKQVLVQYPAGKIVMVLDNARIHHAKLIQPFLAEQQERLELLFLPPYSPDLNPIEGLWKWLKMSVVYNVFYSSIQAIHQNVQAFISEINQTPAAVIDRLCLIL